MNRLWVFLMMLFCLAAPQASASTFALESAYLVPSNSDIPFEDIASFTDGAFKPFS